MSTEKEKKLEAIWRFLGDRTTDFYLIYSGGEDEYSSELKWIKASSWRLKSRENCNKLAAQYHALATHCYEQKQDKILENKKGSQGIPWFGGKIPTGEVTTYPANSLGQRWWHIVIASGAVHKAGYVIVARVAAKEPKELRKYIADIQAILSAEKGPRRINDSK